jgi:hypothetical protein
MVISVYNQKPASPAVRRLDLAIKPTRATSTA